MRWCRAYAMDQYAFNNRDVCLDFTVNLRVLVTYCGLYIFVIRIRALGISAGFTEL